MEYLRFSFFDYLLFGSVFTISCALGIYFGCRRKKETTNNYLLGGKKLPTFPVTMSLAASIISGTNLIGTPADTYMHGSQYAIVTLSILFVAVINNFTCLPLFYNLQIRNVYHYLELRFGKDVKNITTVVYILTIILYLPFLIYAPSIALNQVSGINVYAASWMLAMVCIFYTSIGGFKAVVWTDTLQFTITFSTLMYVLIRGIILAGGVSEMWNTAAEGGRIEFFNMNPDPTIRASFLSVFIGNVFGWLGFFCIAASVVQRFISLPTLEDAQKASIISLTVLAVAKVFSCITGLIIYSKYANCDPLSMGYIRKEDQILPYYVMDIAKNISGVSGLFVAGLFTTALSAFSSGLNTASGILYFEFVSLLLPEDISYRKSTLLLKALTVLLGFTSVCVIFLIARLGSVFQLLFCMSGMTIGPLLGLFIMGMAFPMANKKGAIIGLFSSIVLMSVIIIQNQIYAFKGAIEYTTKPLRTGGCNSTYINATSFLVISTTSPNSRGSQETPFWLYRISFHYYAMVGALFTLIIGLAVSAITKNKNDVVTSDVILPCMRRFIPKKINSTEMVANDEKANLTVHNNKFPDVEIVMSIIYYRHEEKLYVIHKPFWSDNCRECMDEEICLRYYLNERSDITM